MSLVVSLLLRVLGCVPAKPGLDVDLSGVEIGEADLELPAGDHAWLDRHGVRW